MQFLDSIKLLIFLNAKKNVSLTVLKITFRGMVISQILNHLRKIQTLFLKIKLDKISPQPLDKAHDG